MNLSKKLAVSLGLALCGMLGAQVSKADTLIPIQNNSFESASSLTSSCGTGCGFNYGPITGWTQSGDMSGVQMLNSTYMSAPVPDGSLMAFTNGNSSLSQTLTGVSLQANSTYTLSVFVGDRLDNIPANYTFSLLAGGTVLDSFSSNNSLITPGTWQQESFTYSTGSSVAAGDLQIVLSSSGLQADWDDVTLSLASNVNDPVNGDDPPVNTPEPGSFMMLGAGLLGLFGFAAPKSLKS